MSAPAALPSPRPCPDCWEPPLQLSWQWQLEAPPRPADLLDLDDVDGYENRTGFPLTGADQLRFNVFLANGAHRKGSRCS